jgi:hypothetical protein
MKLFNLTFEGKQYVSSSEPNFLPDKNFSFIEITYSKDKINEILGIYNFEGEEKECILSDLEIGFFLAKLDFFEERRDVNLDKINLNFIENKVESKVFKIFIISLASYLIYFDFLNFPFEMSLDLLDNKKLRYFTSFSPNNYIEESWLKQVSTFHRNFSLILKKDTEKEDIQNKVENEVKKGIEKINKEVDILIKEVKEFKKRMISDYKKKETNFQKSDLKIKF